MSLSTRERRLLLLLTVVVVALGLRWVWSAADPLRGGAAVRARTRSAARGAPLASLPQGLVVLRTDRLDRAPAPFEVGRDLFRYGPPPAPPAPLPPTAEELEEARRLAEARARLAQEAAELAAQPRPPAIPYRFIGSFGPEGRRIAVFSDGDAAILNVLEGETFGGQFVLRRIGLESVDVGYTEFPDEAPRRLAVGE